MPKAKFATKIKDQMVLFSFKSVDAKKVFLTGDFNNWNPDTHPMENNGNGIWKKTLMLAPGRYEYRFLVDGNWTIDPQNSQICLNASGKLNNILNLSA